MLKLISWFILCYRFPLIKLWQEFFDDSFKWWKTNISARLNIFILYSPSFLKTSDTCAIKKFIQFIHYSYIFSKLYCAISIIATILNHDTGNSFIQYLHFPCCICYIICIKAHEIKCQFVNKSKNFFVI